MPSIEYLLGFLETAGLGFSIYLFYDLQKRQIKVNELLQFLLKSTVFNPDLLLKVLQNKAPSTYISSIKEFEEGADYIRGLAFIQGIVDCENPIVSTLNKSTKLVFSSLTHTNIFSNKKNLKLNIDGGKVRSVPEFQLLDSQKWTMQRNKQHQPIKMGIENLQKLLDILPDVNDKSVKNNGLKRDFFTNLNDFTEIFDTDKLSPKENYLEIIPRATIRMSNNAIKTKVSPALETIQAKTNLRSLTFLEKLMSYGIYLIKILMTETVSKKIEGFKLGYKKIERGIKLTQFVVAFGEIFYNKRTQELFMTHPISLLKSKVQMIKKIQKQSIKLNKQIGSMFAIMIVMGILVCRRIWKHSKKLMVKIRSKNQLSKMDNLFKMSEQIDDEYKCIICCELPKHVIFKPCLHMACCALCYERMDNNQCFICKQEIEDVVKIYLK